VVCQFVICDLGHIDFSRDFDEGLLVFLLGIFPSHLAPRAYKGRATIQSRLGAYYAAKHDQEPDVSAIIRRRAEVYRKYNMSSTHIGQWEIAAINAATQNTIPTGFWMMTYIASDTALRDTIRQELLSNITIEPAEDGKRPVTIDITKFESHCPSLVAIYRETIRLTNSQVGTRRVMADTIISDGKSNYLLKAGADLQMPSGPSHLSTEIWGANAKEFDITSFMQAEQNGDASEKTKSEERERKRAYFPFGGGKHLCPGRVFAFTEILGMLAALFLGFDVEAEDESLISVPGMRRSKLGHAVARPTEKTMRMGARLKKRDGWEDILWKFKTDKE
jgi:cytochrome P450